MDHSRSELRRPAIGFKFEAYWYALADLSCLVIGVYAVFGGCVKNLHT